MRTDCSWSMSTAGLTAQEICLPAQSFFLRGSHWHSMAGAKPSWKYHDLRNLYLTLDSSDYNLQSQKQALASFSEQARLKSSKHPAVQPLLPKKSRPTQLTLSAEPFTSIPAEDDQVVPCFQRLAVSERNSPPQTPSRVTKPLPPIPGSAELSPDPAMDNEVEFFNGDDHRCLVSEFCSKPSPFWYGMPGRRSFKGCGQINYAYYEGPVPQQVQQKQPTQPQVQPTQPQAQQKLLTQPQVQQKQPTQPQVQPTQPQAQQKLLTQLQVQQKQPTQKQPTQPQQKQPMQPQQTQPQQKQPTQPQVQQKQPTQKQPTQPQQKQPTQPQQKQPTQPQVQQKQLTQPQQKQPTQPQVHKLRLEREPQSREQDLRDHPHHQQQPQNCHREQERTQRKLRRSHSGPAGCFNKPASMRLSAHHRNTQLLDRPEVPPRIPIPPRPVKTGDYRRWSAEVSSGVNSDEDRPPKIPPREPLSRTPSPKSLPMYLNGIMPPTQSFAPDPKYVSRGLQRQNSEGSPCILPVMENGRQASTTHYFLLPQRPAYLDKHEKYFTDNRGPDPSDTNTEWDCHGKRKTTHQIDLV